MDRFEEQNRKFVNDLRSIPKSDLGAQISQLERIKNDVLKKLDCAKAKVKAATSEVAEINKLNKELEARRNQIRQLEGEIIKLRQKLSEGATPEDLTRAQQDVKELRQKIASSEQTYKQTIADLNAEISALKKQPKPKTGEDPSELHTQIQSLRDEKERLEQSLKESKYENKCLQDLVRILRGAESDPRAAKEAEAIVGKKCKELKAKAERLVKLEAELKTSKYKQVQVIEKESEKCKQLEQQANTILKQRDELLSLYKKMATDNANYEDRLREINRELARKVGDCL